MRTISKASSTSKSNNVKAQRSDEKIKEANRKKMKAQYAKNRTKKKSDMKEANKNLRAYAQLGKVVVACGGHTEYISRIEDKNIKERLIMLITNDKTVRRSGRVLSSNTIKKKVPIKYYKDATQCRLCKETCGPDGCSSQCDCALMNRLCEHDDQYYFCAAMPHRHWYPKVKVVEEEFLKGVTDVSCLGLQARENICEMRVIGEYTGEIINKRNLSEINARLEKCDRYIMAAGKYVIDGAHGNEMRYINSSCIPNVHFEVYESQGEEEQEIKIYVVASKDIKCGDMLYAKYGWEEGFFPIKKQCLCKMTDECREGRAMM
jgi:hypothetical protein